MLKCTMIHSYPNEYHALYKMFKDGGTIREWIQEMERLAITILESNEEIICEELKDQLPSDWTVQTGKEFYINGSKNLKGIEVMRSMRAIWVADKKHWTISKQHLREYLYKDDLYKFKGDMLEVLSEIFFTVFKGDEGIGIREYAPVEISEDFGVDAVGINVNGHKVAIQVKYRSNPFDLIPYADIARTFTSAICQMKMDDVVAHDHTVYLFTTSNGETIAYQKVMGNKSVVVNRGIISRKIDNNRNFWDAAFKMMTETLNS